MKLVINKCYGGFGLSPKAIARLSELRGHPCYFFAGFGHDGYGPPISAEQAATLGGFFSAFKVTNPPSYPDNWRDMTPEQRSAFSKEFDEVCIEHGWGLDRADPLLVRVVEELGAEADGKLAKLKVVEIPDGVQYEIDEYDGIESVHEKHEVWA